MQTSYELQVYRQFSSERMFVRSEARRGALKREMIVRGVDGNETCPRCYQVMIELAKFDPLLDAHAAGTDTFALHNFQWWEEDFFIDLVNRPIERFRAWRERRRLSRILRAYPHALHCTACGFTLKRR